MTHEDPGTQFNEDAARAELERLRDSVHAARQARQQKSEEFDRFVRGFRTPHSAPAAEQRDTPSSAPAPAVETPHATAIPPSADPRALPPLVTSDAVATDAPPTPRDRARPPRRLDTRIVAITVVVAIAAAALLISRSRTHAPPQTDTNAVAATPDATPPAATPAPVGSQPAVAPPVQAVTIELRTVQAVWMRVIVDGQKKTEGVIEGGRQLRFGADHSIVVRAGDAGDVLVTTGKGDIPFGQAGQPLTRTFGPPAK